MSTATQSSSRARSAANAPGGTVSVVGIVLGALGLLFGILTGVPGLVCGIVGASKGNRLGWVAIVVAVIATVAGIAIGAVVLGVGRH